ncbi:MAG: Uma2 family endonuclease [Caldilineaceae bacterium]
MTIANPATIVLPPPMTAPIVYPESDGEPMANNSVQFRYITTIEGNLEILLEEQSDVLVAGDMFWYPVEGNNTIRQAPDIMVVWGRPKGDRGSYLQWEEDEIVPQVVFEILSPGNRKQEMLNKFVFYERYGAEEYYLYDPDRGRLQGWLRNAQGRFVEITRMKGWRSPRLQIRFDLLGRELLLYYPDGKRFLTFLELNQRRAQAEARADREAARAHAEAEARAEAEQARLIAEQALAAAEARMREMEERLRQAGVAVSTGN